MSSKVHLAEKASPRLGRVFLGGWSVRLMIILILCSAAFVRQRLIDLPLERDEGEYAYTGQLMLQRIPPYKLAYNMKLPGTYAAYAAIMAAFGETTRGIHTGLIVVNSITVLLAYFLGRRLFGTICGVVAAASFALLSLSPSVLGLAAHATHFVTLFAVAGTLLLLLANEKERPTIVFGSGVLFGLSFLMKQQAVFFVLAGGLMLVWDEVWRRPREFGKIVTRLALYIAGAALPFGIACAMLARAGVFSRFWFWTFSYAGQYAAILPIARGWENLQVAFSLLWRSAPGLWMLAMLGFLLVLCREENRRTVFFTVAFLAASFATACPGFYFREHYFVPLLASGAILIGAAVQLLLREISSRGGSKAWLVAPLMIIVAAFGDGLFRQWTLFFKLDPAEAARAIYRGNPFPEAQEIARYIRDHSTPDSRIAVLGSEPEIYFYSKHHSATGYIYTYALMEPHKYALAMQREMIAEIEASKPEFVVLVNVPSSWLEWPDSNSLIFDWFEKYWVGHLQTVGLVDIFIDRPSIYRWDEKAVAVTPRSTSNVRIYKRNDLF
jgi:hypothetical protein